MNKTWCQCGTKKTSHNGALWCSHCDEPHRAMTTREVCQQCVTYKASNGIGPSS